ncbi:MAG TPA: hypothetical protein VMX16_04445 [Terriglobia bacterium]|nr:hypothetical protein [Terriglobia bacterium]
MKSDDPGMPPGEKQNRGLEAVIHSIRNALILCLLALLFVVPKFYLRRSLKDATALRKTVSVLSDKVPNLVFPDAELIGVRARFTLLSNPKTVIKSYFIYRISVTNTGGESLENGELYVRAPAGVTLVGEPLKRTEPPGLVDAMRLSHDSPPSRTEKDQWRIGLLNPGETLTLMYAGYSTRNFEASQLKAIFRKKDWSASYGRGDLAAWLAQENLQLGKMDKMLNWSLILLSVIFILRFLETLRERSRLRLK